MLRIYLVFPILFHRIWKKKKISSIGRNVLIKITLRWIFSVWNFSNVLSYLVPSLPNSWKTAIPLENWRRKVSSASRPGVSTSKLLTFDFVLCRLLNVAKPRVKFARVESIQRGNPWNVCREPANLACYLRPCCCSLHMKEKKEWKRKGLNSIGRKGEGKRQKREKDNV